MLVGLLAELDEATESGVFYDRVCQAVVTLTTMKRAVLLLHDETYRSVIPVGACGIAPELMKRIGGTIDETPIAQIALDEVPQPAEELGQQGLVHESIVVFIRHKMIKKEVSEVLSGRRGCLAEDRPLVLT